MEISVHINISQIMLVLKGGGEQHARDHSIQVENVPGKCTPCRVLFILSLKNVLPEEERLMKTMIAAPREARWSKVVMYGVLQNGILKATISGLFCVILLLHPLTALSETIRTMDNKTFIQLEQEESGT